LVSFRSCSIYAFESKKKKKKKEKKKKKKGKKKKKTVFCPLDVPLSARDQERRKRTGGGKGKKKKKREAYFEPLYNVTKIRDKRGKKKKERKKRKPCRPLNSMSIRYPFRTFGAFAFRSRGGGQRGGVKWEKEGGGEGKEKKGGVPGGNVCAVQHDHDLSPTATS